MAPERVYLHIGAPKTGTTYLQTLMAANRSALKDAGILYPQSKGDAHHTAAWDLRGIPPQRQHSEGIAGAWSSLVQRANAWSGSAAVVSSELFVFCNAKQIQTALFAFDAEVHVVYSSRDLVRQVPAVWQERVKNQQTTSYPDFIDLVRREARGAGGQAFWRAQDAAAVAERWSVGMSPRQMHIVTAPKAGTPPSVLWDRFTTVFGCRGHDYETSFSGAANTSLGLLQTELLRRYNERRGSALRWPDYRRTVRSAVKRSFGTAVDDRRQIALPPADQAFFAAAAADITARLRSAGYDVVGDLDDLLPAVDSSGVEASQPTATVATDEEVLGAALDVLHAELTLAAENRRAQRGRGRSRRTEGA